jgi:hypothetical protein
MYICSHQIGEQMMTEYLVKFRKFFGPNDVWAESVDGRNDREAIIREIEDSDFEVACVLAVECIDHRYEARDVTESVMAEVRDREVKHLTNKYYDANPNITLDEFIWAHSRFADRVAA